MILVTDGNDSSLRPGYTQRRDYGCIVTWRDPQGRERVRHEPGHVREALRAIVVGIPPGSEVLCISTPASIERDLQGPRYYGGASQHDRVDPWQVERTLLGQVRRMDLLPARAHGA